MQYVHASLNQIPVSAAWVDIISMYHMETGLVEMDWIHFTDDRAKWRTLLNTIRSLHVPQNAVN
jgi:hypothetical protein